MKPVPGDPELLNHFAVLIYPFRHHVTGRRRNARLAALDPRWAPWATRFDEAELATTLEATGFFLPYIRGLLYPDIHRLQEATPCEDHAEWARLLSGWSGAGTGAYVAGVPASGVVRLTLRPGIMQILGEMSVIRPIGIHGHGELNDLPASCAWIDTLLFPSGLGFLLLNVRCADERPRLSSLVHLQQALRNVHPLTRAMPMPVLRLGSGEEITVRALMNFLTQGLVSSWAIPEEDRGIFLEPACGTGDRPYTDTEAGRSYGERCHLMSYACVDLSRMAADELPAGAFASATDRILFEYATCIGLGESVHNAVWIPSPEQAARLSRENRLALWHCWTGMVLKESMVFLATEDLGFTRRSLPRHVENNYLPLYLFTLYQKLQLFTFATEMMHEVAHSRGHLREARALAQRFVTFRTQYWFGEVTRKPQGSELYRTFQHGLEVQSSYELVTSSVRDVKDYYESVWARQVQWCKDALTYGGPVTMALGAARWMVGDSPHLWTAAALSALGVAVIVILRMCLPIRRANPRMGRGRLAGAKSVADQPVVQQETRMAA
jgi:hypothetical protein